MSIGLVTRGYMGESAASAMPTAAQRLFREDGCQLLKNESDESKRRFVFHLFNALGESVNDVIPTSGQLRVSKSGDSIADGGGDWAPDGGPGIYVYTATQSETNTSHFVSISVNVPGVVPVSVFKRIGGPTIAVGASHRRHPVFLVVDGAVYEGGDFTFITAMYDGSSQDSRDWNWGEVGDGHYWFEMDEDAVSQERVITFVFGVDAEEGSFAAHWVANLQVAASGGAGGSLALTIISPTPGAAPGTAGGFPASKFAADATPVVIRITDPTPGDGRFAVVTLDVDDHREVVYWRNSFVDPYRLRSISIDLGGGVLELRVRRDGGWPQSKQLAFRANAFDGDDEEDTP